MLNIIGILVIVFLVYQWLRLITGRMISDETIKIISKKPLTEKQKERNAIRKAIQIKINKINMKESFINSKRGERLYKKLIQAEVKSQESEKALKAKIKSDIRYERLQEVAKSGKLTPELIAIINRR